MDTSQGKGKECHEKSRWVEGKRRKEEGRIEKKVSFLHQEEEGCGHLLYLLCLSVARTRGNKKRQGKKSIHTSNGMSPLTSPKFVSVSFVTIFIRLLLIEVTKP